MQKITSVAKKLNLSRSNLVLYGDYMAKIKGVNGPKSGKLILVSAITPTTSGEGKTTVSIGLADAMNYIGYNTCLALREPSLGPVFGMKGGACGGGKSEILPSVDINLHFTGDLHAITSANNLLCAMIDNSIFQGNALDIDPKRVVFHRCLDMNDRALRQVEISREKLKSQSPRAEEFVITAASEIMALMCLSRDFDDLKRRLGNILVAYSRSGKPIFARDLGANEAMAVLLYNALMPNLVQTGYGNPAIVHLGPFANIAHGCNSVVATKLALSLSDYVVTEAGFGADLGGEKFLDVKCRTNDLAPDCVVIVATIKALKLHGNGDIDAGFCNLEKHISNFKDIYNRRVVVALNIFAGDTDEEIARVVRLTKALGVEAIPCSPYILGRSGCVDLARAVHEIVSKRPNRMHYPYDLDDSLRVKIEKLAKSVYGAGQVIFSDEANENIKAIGRMQKGLPIVVAKTQYSLSDDAKKLGAPKGFDFHVRRIEIKCGAEFIVVEAGNISLMPGLSKVPNAVKMSIDKFGTVKNLK